MIAHTPTMIAKSSFSGVRQIVRWNLTFYVVAAATILICSACLWIMSVPSAVGRILVVGIILVGWWCVSSLAASHWIYDRSGVMDWRWLGQEMRGRSDRWLSIHSGLDYSGPVVPTLYPNTSGRLLDIFDPQKMTEPSIRLARQKTGLSMLPSDVKLDRLPVEDQSIDSVLLLFVAHELRDPADRLMFFEELHRVLRLGGQILMVEHLRDVPNFVAFGPGFLHFLPMSEWRRLAEASGFSIEKTRTFTPFVACYRWRKRTWTSTST